jgi:hypothetical protein
MWKFKRTREREYLSGIMARDLEDAEVEALSTGDRERMEASGLYRHVDDEPPKPEPSGRAARGGEG